MEYLKDLNATAAAERAGYKNPNKQGPRLLVNVGIQAEIQKRMKDRAERLEITADNVLRELAVLGFADIGQVLDFSGPEPKLKPANEISEAGRRLISSMKVKRYFEGNGENAREVEVTEFKLWDKKGALELLGKHFGLFPNKVDHTGSVELHTVGIKVVISERKQVESVPPAIQSRMNGSYNGNGHANGHHANGNGSSAMGDGAG